LLVVGVFSFHLFGFKHFELSSFFTIEKVMVEEFFLFLGHRVFRTVVSFMLAKSSQFATTVLAMLHF